MRKAADRRPAIEAGRSSAPRNLHRRSLIPRRCAVWRSRPRRGSRNADGPNATRLAARRRLRRRPGAVPRRTAHPVRALSDRAGTAAGIGEVTPDVRRYVEHIAAHPRERFAPVALIVDTMAAGCAGGGRWRSCVAAGTGPDPAGTPIADGDYDALIDLAGMAVASGTAAQRPAWSVWTYRISSERTPRRLSRTRYQLGPRATTRWSASHCGRIRPARLCTNAPWFAGALPVPDAIAKVWRAAVTAHQADADAAIDGYRSVRRAAGLCASALSAGAAVARSRRIARSRTRARRRVASAPTYTDARGALRTWSAARARRCCRGDLPRGFGVDGNGPSVACARLAELARAEGEAAREAFEQALALAPTDGETTQPRGRIAGAAPREEALRAYQRASPSIRTRSPPISTSA